MLSNVSSQPGRTSRSYKETRLIPVRIGDKLPGYRAPCWDRWSRPVKSFLTRPRTWKQLDDWAAQQNIPQSLLKNIVAWMDINHVINHDPQTKQWSLRKESQ